MKKHFFLLLTAVGFFSLNSTAQTVIPCKTSEMLQKAKERSSQVEAFEKTLDAQTKAYISSGYINKFARTTSVDLHDDTDYYDIPLVVHVIHNYGRENYLTSDNRIYELVKEMNKFYDNQTSFATVVSEFRPYIGHPKIRFYLATKDPYGNPTNGITRRRTYLTYGYDNEAKVDQWPPTSYVNIWFENVIGETNPGVIIVAYATPPASAAAQPFWDGIISNYSFINDAVTDIPERTGGSIDHEMGHIFNLKHTFGGSNSPHTNTPGNCTDDDDVDDTPPCEGNLGGCNLTDTVCSRNYFKTYPAYHGGDSLVNYPDTANEQNIMNYADCKVMFTKGQVARMRAALNSDVGGRNNLWDSLNLVSTGVGTIDYATGNVTPFTHVDLKPNPEFAAFVGTLGDPTSNTAVTSGTYRNVVGYFTFPGKDVKFVNESWNDTLAATTWTFSNGAAQPTVTQTNPVMGQTAFLNNFSQPGWVNLSMKVTGNGTGDRDTTATWPRAVFVADANGTTGLGYNQDFNGADTAKWPMFNYYNNNLHWQMSSVGRYDHSSIEYVAYDDRLNPLLGAYPTTATPKGDFDDMFTAPFDLTSFGTGNCTMNFRYASASRSPISLNLNDTLEIWYTVDKVNWVKMTSLTKGTLINNGSVSVPFTPYSPDQWALFSMDVPTAARTNYVVFRFRYRPGVGIGHDAAGNKIDAYSSGNNFYMDDFNFSPWAAGVEDLKLASIDMAIVPNPTNGDAYVVIKDASNATAQLSVTDITGKVVYSATQQMSGSQAQIQIPHAAISVSGMYLVRVATGSQVRTEKLVVQ